jgi:hypothetical protein
MTRALVAALLVAAFPFVATGCGERATDADHAVEPAVSYGAHPDLQFSRDGKSVILTYQDGSRLIINAGYTQSDSLSFACFDPGGGPDADGVDVYGVEGHPGDNELDLWLTSCGGR